MYAQIGLPYGVYFPTFRWWCTMDCGFVAQTIFSVSEQPVPGFRFTLAKWIPVMHWGRDGDTRISFWFIFDCIVGFLYYNDPSQEQKSQTGVLLRTPKALMARLDVSVRKTQHFLAMVFFGHSSMPETPLRPRLWEAAKTVRPYGANSTSGNRTPWSQKHSVILRETSEAGSGQ